MHLFRKYSPVSLSRSSGALLLLVCFLMVASGKALAFTIYVAPTGKDTNPGTVEKPLATLEAARDRARMIRKGQQLSEPIEVVVAPGNYVLQQALTLTAEDSGTEESPLVFRGEKGPPPVFSGGIALPAFEKVSDRLWKITVPPIALYGGSFGQLFINGKRATRARTPNQNRFFKTKKAVETPIDTSKKANVGITTKKVYLTSAQLQALEAINGADLQNVIISIHHAWDRTRKYIQAKSTSDSAVYIIGRQMHPWNKLDNSSQFIFENAKAFLDAPGEWFLEPAGTLFYIPRPGELMEQSIAVVPVIDKFLVIAGNESQKVQHIRFENLSFQFTRYRMPLSGNENAQAAAPTEAAIMVDYARNIQFDHLEVSHTANNGIWFRTDCADSRLDHSYFHDLGIGGVKIGELKIPENRSLITNNITIDNNILRSGGHEFPTGVGVTIFQSGDNTVSHNDISDFIYSGVSVGWIWGYKESPAKRNKIVFNHIHHLGWGLLSDMGGVYTLGPSEGTEVSNNVIHHIYSYGYGGWGLYTDEGSTGVVMENNLVYKCKSAGFHQHYGKDNIIRNNIFALQLKAQLEATRVEDHQGFSFTNNIVYFDGGKLAGINWDKANFSAKNNAYWDTRTKKISFGQQSFRDWQRSGKDKSSVLADPKFVDPAGGNFHFKNKSLVYKIGFKPFDYSGAGVYGEAAWKKLAAFDPDLARQFEQTVTAMENL
jgi:hypothetical protein